MTGRNELCPCGSGKKYKYCCLDKERSSFPNNVMEEIEDFIKEKLGDQQLGSMEELQILFSEFNEKMSTRSRDEFLGLSPEVMHRFLHFAFESPQFVQFNDDLRDVQNTCVLQLFMKLAEACGEKGLKTTQKGNLPIKLCREIKESYIPTVHSILAFRSLNTETQFHDLHVVRIIARAAGLLRKQHGRFHLTKKCVKLMKEQAFGKIYLELFKSHTRKYNWGYGDGFGKFWIIQGSFLFSLYMLQRFGSEYRETKFYEDKFLTAFPSIQEEIPTFSFGDLEYSSRCFSLRTFERFCSFFGLIETTIIKEDYLRKNYKVKKTPLLDALVTYNI